MHFTIIPVQNIDNAIDGKGIWDVPDQIVILDFG